MEQWFVRSVIIENGQEVTVDEGPWDHDLAEAVLADISLNPEHSIPRGPLWVPSLRSWLVPAETFPDLTATDDTLVEPRHITGHGPDGPSNGRGRGELTDADKACLLAFCKPS